MIFLFVILFDVQKHIFFIRKKRLHEFLTIAEAADKYKNVK